MAHFRPYPLRTWLIGNLIALALAPQAFASSHREAPFITKQPKVDATAAMSPAAKNSSP
jgi:hypothetical protein